MSDTTNFYTKNSSVSYWCENRFITEIFAVAVVIILYSMSLTGEFIADDWGMIDNNADKMTGLDSIVRFFSAGVWNSSNMNFEDTNRYRPFWLLWQFFIYQIAEENVFIWRLSNLVLHALNMILVVRLTGAIFPSTNNLERMFAGLIFALHPAATHSVALITGSTDVVMATFALGAMLFYIRAREEGRYIYLVASLFCYGAALFTKEPAIVLPAVLLAWEIFVFLGDKSSMRSRIGVYFSFGLIAGLYLFARSFALDGESPDAGAFISDGQSLLRTFEYALRYAGMAAAPWPVPFFVKHPDASFMSDPLAIHQMIIGVGATILMMVAFLKSKTARFAIIWTALFCAAPIALALHSTGMFGPRFMYLPLVGFTLLVLAGYLWLKSNRAINRVWTLVVPVILVAALTLIELPSWRNQMTWGEKMIASAPTVRNGWTAKGLYLTSVGKTEAVKDHYRKAYQTVEDEKWKAKFAEFLAILHANDKELRKSSQAYYLITEIKGSEAIGFVGLGNIAWVSNRLDAAINAYHKALEYEPNNIMAVYNIAKLSEVRGDAQTALTFYTRSLKIPAPKQFAQAMNHAKFYVSRYGKKTKQPVAESPKPINR